MDPATCHLIEAIHQAPFGCVLALTGGGTTAAGMLLAVPGGSRTILEVLVPYQERALVELLGRRPEQFCSAATSRELAHRAYDRARWLAPGTPVIGLGCTASLATDRPKRGDHRFHVATVTSDRVATCSLILSKGARERLGEEAVVAGVLLNALAEACGLSARLEVPLMPDELLGVERQPEAGQLSAFFRGELRTVRATMDGQIAIDSTIPPLLLPGSFNPVHAGHWGLAAAACRLTGWPTAFELSVTNVDKPALTAEEVERRLGQFHWKAPVWLTRAPTFVEKAALFRGTTFVVGADTALRIVAPRYYQDSEARMLAALEHIRALGGRFLVAGRVDPEGRYVGLGDLPIPAAFRDLFREIPESEFRRDLSSTELRAQAAGRATPDAASQR